MPTVDAYMLVMASIPALSEKTGLSEEQLGDMLRRDIQNGIVSKIYVVRPEVDDG